ncbi:MAG TPA: hypothetical protein VH415_11770 [Nitrososphaeraceae archaeon]
MSQTAPSSAPPTTTTDAELYSNFINSLRSKFKKASYDYVLKRFMTFHRVQEEKY